MAVLILQRQGDCLVESTGGNSSVQWTLTEYTEPREFLYPCEVCGMEIEEWSLLVCLDGGESAHTGCAVIM